MRIEVKLRDGTQRFEALPGERLLHAGLRCGVDLPYECASGTCGTCKARLVEGEVEDLWSEAPGRKYLAGPQEFLLCQCAARTDCSMEVRPRGQVPVPSVVPQGGDGIVGDARLLAPDILAFSVDVGRAIDFDAGQFVGLELAPTRGFRSYSMVNYAKGGSRLDFVVKRKPDGGLTPRLFDRPIAGQPVRWYGPMGRAIFQPGKPHDILCIAGGTGIAGMMSILRCAVHARHFEHSRGSLFFGVRSMRDAFYLDELDALAGASDGALAVTVALSEEDPAGDANASYRHLDFRRGLVHEVAKSAMGGTDGRFGGIAYLAGPKPAVDAAMRVLLAARVPAPNIRFDKFS